ncbi:MAG TPA: ATP-binding protein [Vicinamibacterales bacterium]
MALGAAALALYLAAAPVSAQEGLWRVTTSDGGLPETSTYHVAADSTGRVWTSHGVPLLGLYDGYGVRRQLVGTTELHLSIGPDDELWTTTHAGVLCSGVQRFNGEVWQRVDLPAADRVPYPDVRLLAWRQDRALLLTPGTLFEADATTGRLEPVAVPGGVGRLRQLHPARDGGVWVSGERGLSHLSRDHVWTPLALPDGTRPDWVFDSPRGLLVVVSRPDGDVVLRSTAGTWTQVSANASGEPIVAAWDGVDDALWIASGISRGFRLSVLRPDRPIQHLPRMHALSGRLHDVLPAADGGFWLATSLGLVRHLPAVWRRPAAPAHRPIHTGALIQLRSGDIVAVQEDGVLVHRPGGSWLFQALPRAALSNIHYSDVLAELPDGRVMIGRSAQQSPLVFDVATRRFEALRHPEGRLVEILGRTHDGLGAWTMTRLGAGRARIERFDGRRFTTRAELDGQWEGEGHPYVILELANGDLIVTPTPHGVGHLHGNQWTWYQGATDIPEVLPFTAAELPDGRIWFGGRSGLTELRGSSLRRIRGGLQTVRSIIAGSHGDVWAASNSGVHWLHEGSWTSLTAEDGLPDGAVFDVLEDGAGRIWAATSAGLSVRHVDADREPPETQVPADVNATEAPPSGEMRLTFTGVDRYEHTERSRLVYSYRLNDGAWSAFTGSTGVTLTAMPAGPYVFAVRAMDRNGRIDGTPAEWQLTVLRPWYREPGVLALTLLGLIAALIALALFVTRHRRLERLVEARTRQLREELSERQRVEQERAELEQQLQQSQRMEALGRLAGGISHDFNNLLTVICSYADLLTEELSADDPRHAHAEEIVKAGNRATLLTQQLLQFSRHQAVQRQVVDLNTTLADLLSMLGRLLGEDVHVRFIPASGLWPIRAHRGQLEQVVVNLAVNARDAMPMGGTLAIETANVTLEDDYVRTHVDARPGPHVRLSVTDTGTGMDPATLQRIFEPFFTTKPQGQGSGLGLAMVYGIVRQHDGHIEVRSAPGRGTRFDIYLPRTFDEAPPPPGQERRARLDGRETILLVEDEDAVRQLAQDVLTRYGYHVVPAASGEEALRLVEAQQVQPDVLVSDIVMPGIHGTELAMRLRDRWPGLPVILMSGYTNDFDDLRPAQGVAFLQKPFTAVALGQKVGEALGTRA